MYTEFGVDIFNNFDYPRDCDRGHDRASADPNPAPDDCSFVGRGSCLGFLSKRSYLRGFIFVTQETNHAPHAFCNVP